MFLQRRHSSCKRTIAEWYNYACLGILEPGSTMLTVQARCGSFATYRSKWYCRWRMQKLSSCPLFLLALGHSWCYWLWTVGISSTDSSLSLLIPGVTVGPFNRRWQGLTPPARSILNIRKRWKQVGKSSSFYPLHYTLL